MKTLNKKKTETWALVLASVAAFMVILDSLIVSVTLSTIRQDLTATIEELEWTVNAYSLSFAVLLMTASAIGDRFGRRRMFIWGLVLFTASSVLCALSNSIEWLIIARVIQGAGASFVMPLAMSLLAAAIPAEKRAKALGIFTGIGGLAVLSGPVIGGAITEGIAWQWIFWINVPVGLILIPFVLKYIDESFGKDTKIDMPALVYVILASFGLVWGLVRGNEAGWFSAEVLAAILGGVLFTALFIRRENCAKEPMVPLRLFANREFTFGNISTFFLYGSVYSTVFFMAQFLQIVQQYSPLDAGLRVLPWTATMFIISPISGSLVNKVGARTLISIGLFIQALALAWIASVAKPGVAYTDVIIPFALAGTGVSLAMPATQSAVINAVGRQEVGKASGVFNMLRQLGAAFGIAILVIAFSASGSHQSAIDFTNGFVPAIYTSATLSLLGAVSALCIPRRQIVLQNAIPQAA